MSLGKRLRKKRKERKLTQKEVADILGIDHTTVSKWESDIYEPDTSTLNKLAGFYEVTVDWLTGNLSDEQISQIIEKAGEPGSSERNAFTKKFMEEFNKLPEGVQQNLFDLIKTMPKK